MKKPVKIGGKIVDWRDASSFDIVVYEGQTVTMWIRPEALPCVVDVSWGDVGYNRYTYSTLPQSLYSYTHTYKTAGKYKINIKTTSKLAGLNCTYCSRYNAGYSKQFDKLSYVLINGGTSAQDYTNYIGIVKFISVETTPIKLDLGRLTFHQDTTRIVISGSNPNLSGVIRVPNLLLNLTAVTLHGTGSVNHGYYSLNEIIANTPNATYYNFQSYSSTSPISVTSDFAEMATLLNVRQSITDFIIFSMHKGITGNASALFKGLFERADITSIYIQGAGIYSMELGVQNNDYYAHSPKILYLAHIIGDVSQFNFKYTAVTFLALFMDSGAYGDLNSISNVRQSTILRIILTIPNSVTLDVINIKHLNPVAVSIVAGNSLSGDISQLGSWVKCETWSLSSLSSNTITGWSNLVNNLYNNRSLFSSGPKSFNCPNVMRVVISGIYQAPAGFVKGSADGTPANDRERIYVLVENYNWVFTNI